MHTQGQKKTGLFAILSALMRKLFTRKKKKQQSSIYPLR